MYSTPTDRAPENGPANEKLIADTAAALTSRDEEKRQRALQTMLETQPAAVMEQVARRLITLIKGRSVVTRRKGLVSLAGIGGPAVWPLVFQLEDPKGWRLQVDILRVLATIANSMSAERRLRLAGMLECRLVDMPAWEPHEFALHIIARLKQGDQEPILAEAPKSSGTPSKQSGRQNPLIQLSRRCTRWPGT